MPLSDTVTPVSYKVSKLRNVIFLSPLLREYILTQHFKPFNRSAMKNLIVLFATLLFCFALHAQFKKLAESPLFEEPEDGFAKILQMKDGSTLFFHIKKKEGVDVQVYDADHKQKASKHFEPKFGDLKKAEINAIFEVSGDAVLFISDAEDKIPTLYRLIIDGKTGSLKNESKIAELNKSKIGQGFASAKGYVPGFFVRNDPNSNTYALALMNTFENDKDKKIEIVFYGADNQEISRAYYNSPDDRYKYMEYIDMAVIGKEKICVLADAFNTKSIKGRSSELVIATLNAGSKEVVLDELNFAKNMIVKWGLVRYNPIPKRILLLAVGQSEDGSAGFESFLASINPEQRTLESATAAYPQQASQKNMELFGNKKPFTGLPQNLFINGDGTYSIIFEEMAIYSSNYSSSTNLGNIAVSKLDADNKEISSCLIPKDQMIQSTYLLPFYHSRREGSAQVLYLGNQFKSFAYLNGKAKSYVLFNDIERNGESIKKGKVTRVFSVGECDGYYFDVTGNNVLPERKFVFPTSKDNSAHNLGLFAISDYDRERNIYITLKLVKEGRREKNVQLVWLQPE